MMDAIVQQSTIGQAGERIMEREIVCVFLGVVTLRQVDCDREPALLRREAGARGQHVALGPVAARELVLARVAATKRIYAFLQFLG